MSDSNSSSKLPWYGGVTSYQWLVLVVCSLGWVFDVFEGQIFVASMRDAMPNLLGVESADNPLVARWNNIALASFLLGGALGGVMFGVMSDKIGRSKTMIITILFYSIFTCITALATEAWHMVVLRFLVAMGVGGEWAVASAMVAEVMPKHSRPAMSSIFHASSVFGTLLATAVGFFILAKQPWGDKTWKLGFLIGVLPALLILVIRWKMHEPEQWLKAKAEAAKDPSKKTGSLGELFNAQNLRATVVGVSLATIGLITFWGCHIYGKNALLRHAQTTALVAEGVAGDAPKAEKQAVFAKHKAQIKKAEMTSMTLNTIGGGLGLVLFGWFSNRLGRRGAFVFYHAGAMVMVLLLFVVLIPNGASYMTLAIVLPIFGFLTLGMHAGYAVYFPELYPTRLRGTGTGFCFNMGRLGTAAYLLFVAKVGWAPEQTALYVAAIYVLGIFIALQGPETRGKELPD
ncbi:MAG: MFS family permease [Candidatus Binatia bacterium]|jgi:MFS family permease